MLLRGITITDDHLQAVAILRRDPDLDPCSHSKSMDHVRLYGNPPNASDHYVDPESAKPADFGGRRGPHTTTGQRLRGEDLPRRPARLARRARSRAQAHEGLRRA